MPTTLFPAGAIEDTDYATTTNATPELFVTSARPRREPGDDAEADGGDDESLFDPDAEYDLESLLGAFDDDERWKEVARTGRAL